MFASNQVDTKNRVDNSYTAPNHFGQPLRPPTHDRQHALGANINITNIIQPHIALIEINILRTWFQLTRPTEADLIFFAKRHATRADDSFQRAHTIITCSHILCVSDMLLPKSPTYCGCLRSVMLKISTARPHHWLMDPSEATTQFYFYQPNVRSECFDTFNNNINIPRGDLRRTNRRID